MCFYNSMSKSATQLAARYNKKTDQAAITQPQYYIPAFKYPLLPVITAQEQIQHFNWGLIPSWTKTAEDANKIRLQTLNARSETIFEKPSFKHSIISHRCIIPTTGYFEFRHEGKHTIPYYIQLKQQEIFSFAGIYSIWKNNINDENLTTFSILTTDANPMLQYIHNTKKRMPVILAPENENAWLNPQLNQQQIQSLLQPYDQDKMNVHEVENFLKKSPFDETVIMLYTSLKQTDLF